jgi:hypothetical protein
MAKNEVLIQPLILDDIINVQLFVLFKLNHVYKNEMISTHLKNYYKLCLVSREREVAVKFWNVRMWI